MSDLRIPSAWQKVASSWTSPVLVLGGTDTGKSTAVRVFYEMPRAAHNHGHHWEIRNRVRSAHHDPHGDPVPEGFFRHASADGTTSPVPGQTIGLVRRGGPAADTLLAVVAVRRNLNFPVNQLVVLASNDGFVETLGRINAIGRRPVRSRWKHRSSVRRRPPS